MKKAVLFLGLLISSYYIAQEKKLSAEDLKFIEKHKEMLKKFEERFNLIQNSEKVLPHRCDDKQVLQNLRKNTNEIAIIFSIESGAGKYYPYTRYEVTNYSIYDPKEKVINGQSIENNIRACEATMINHSIPQNKGKFMYFVVKTKKGLVVAQPLDVLFLLGSAGFIR